MEEFEYKLKQNNPILVAQSVSKLVQVIIDKWNNSANHSKDIPEIKYLKNKCVTTENHLISLTISSGITLLVEAGILQILPTISDLLSSLPVAK